MAHSKVTRKKFLHTGTSLLGFSALSPFGFGESLPWKKFPEHIHTNEDETIRVLELRNYLLKPGMRDKFNRYFAEHFVTPQHDHGGYILGRFAINGEDDRFFWMRGFSNMQTRSKFLPAFYGGSQAWKTFGPGANDMMLEVDNVHLVRPLAETRRSSFLTSSRMVVIDYYTAQADRLEELIAAFRSALLPQLTSRGLAPSLWISEMTANDFPRLPVVQDPNLLVAITGCRDEAEYRGAIASVAKDVKEKFQRLLKTSRALVLKSQ